MKTRRHRGWRWLAGALLAAGGAAAAAMVFILWTEPGRLWLAAQVARALSADARTVQVEGVRISLPLRLAVGRVAVADREGDWLEIRDAECHGALRALLRGRMVIDSLRIGAVDLVRLPAVENAEPREPALPRLPELRMESVVLGRVRIAAEAFGFPVDATDVQGKVRCGEREGAAFVGIEAQAAGVTVAAVTGQTVVAAGELSLGRDRWGVAGSLAGAGFRVAGELGFPGEGMWPTGELRATFDGASGLASAWWPELSSGEFSFSWHCDPRQDGREVALVRFAVAGLQAGKYAVQGARTQVRLERPQAQSGPALEADAQLEDFTFNGMCVTGAAFRMAGPWGAWDVAGTAEGALAYPFAVDAAGRLQWNGDRRELELKQGGASWAGAQVRLTDPLRVWIQGGQTSIGGAARLEPFDLASVSSVAAGLPAGSVAGEFRLGGTLAAPGLEGQVTCMGISGKTGPWAVLPALEGTCRFAVSNGQFWAAAEAQAPTNGSARAEVRVPVQLSLVPWMLQVDREGPLTGDLRVDVGLALPEGVEALGTYGLASGQVSASLRVAGTLAAPAFAGEVAGQDFSGRTGLWTALPPATGSGQFSASNGVLKAAAEVRLGGKRAVASAEAQVPVDVSLVPWNLQWDRAGELSADFRAGLDLALLNDADFMANSRMGGQLDVSVAHRGALSGGTITGLGTLAGGAYENHVLGTVIREASLRLVARGDELVVESGSATDGGRGRLALSGHIRPDLSAGLPYELEIDCRKATLLRRPDAEATVSGKLALAGTVSRLRAQGELTLDNAVVDLRNLRPPRPAELEPASAPESAAGAPQTTGDALALRLAVSLPGTLYVRGRTLDSAWAGDLVLEYGRGGPGLSGYLEPRRGTILFLKRPFKLSEGRIDFANRWPPDPLVRITAVSVRSDLTARALITGPASDPELTLTSEPALPEDEILAQILFGKNQDNLTPLQVVSLASEASKLRKIGGGTGFLNDLQAAVGIDRVELRETGEDASAPEVAVGKYLGDRSYVEMRHAAAVDSSERTRIYVEHELRPNVALEAESGLEMRSGVGLFWKLDY